MTTSAYSWYCHVSVRADYEQNHQQCHRLLFFFVTYQEKNKNVLNFDTLDVDAARKHREALDAERDAKLSKWYG